MPQLTRTIFAPYRISPLGAHVDHQGGLALGRTLALGTTLEYEPLDSGVIHITSEQFGGAQFLPGELDLNHWARYAQAAARLLQVKHGMRARLRGSLVGAGLSSSASVGLAFLRALASLGELELSKEQLIRLDYALEHEQLGLQNGLLDPLTIVFGKKDALLLMDTLTGSVTPIPDSPSSEHVWIVAYSGISRELTKSAFNLRVEECRQAAACLSPPAQILSDVPRDLFEARKSSLPENLRRRARHFFTEVERVQRGATAWGEANLALFGRLMNESCRSSINNYESGSEILIELHELASSTEGVYGSRFSGGGYGGCVVALAAKPVADAARLEIAEKFAAKHPGLPSRVFIAEMGDGLQ